MRMVLSIGLGVVLVIVGVVVLGPWRGEKSRESADPSPGAVTPGTGTQIVETPEERTEVIETKREKSDKAFVKWTEEAGLRHLHHKPVLDKKLDNIMPWMASVGAAAAAADYDNDGDIDLYVTNSQMGKPNRLFRNNGHGVFTDVAAEANVANANAEHGASMDAIWGDYDNDGRLDLYVVKWGRNILYHQNGDGTFTDVTEKAGVGDPGNGNAAVWLDYNDDSRLDIYIGNYFRYVDLWHLEDTRQMHRDFERARDGGPNVLYRQNDDGTFTEVAKEMGVDDTGWTLDVGCADYDNDGDQDLVLANDFGQDRVYRLNPDSTFTNVTDQAIGWDTHKGMNVEFGDYNNDGWLDLYITNIWTKEYVQEGNQLYRNLGDGTFTDISFEAEVYDAGWAWCGRFWDYDNDGDLDIIVANGYISGDPDDEYFTKLALAVTEGDFDSVEARNWPAMGNSTFAGYEPMRVWRNEGNEVFKEVAAEVGLADTGDGRGLAIADFDNDGDLDVYAANQGQEGVYYRNEAGNQNNWLKVDLVGTHCNRNAIGTRVKVVSEDWVQIREVDGGDGDHSQCPYRLHFGLGKRTAIDYVEIRWTTGYVERFENVKPNQILKHIEQTPGPFLAERQRFKEAEIEAQRRAAEREKREGTTTGADSTGRKPADWDQLAKFKKEYLKFKSAIRKAPKDPKIRYDFAMLLDGQDRRGAALTELEQAIELEPDKLLYSNTYRTLVRRYGHVYYDRAIRFFEALADKHPEGIMPGLNKALAYVDKMPYPKLGIVSQGKLSNKSINELNRLLKIDAGCWTAMFIRAMNHLHWPRKLGHAPLAIEDFTKLIAMQNAFPEEKQRDYFALAYVGLGDAHVKNRETGFEENFAKAREAWKRGLEEYPSSPDLKERLELLAKSTDELIEFIKRLRGLEDPVDTDLSRVWVE